jgi:hypothetical protein
MPRAVTFMWTALPRRVRDNKLELTAFLSIRLTPAATPSQLYEFQLFDTWPAQLASAEFEVHFPQATNPIIVLAQPRIVGDPQLFVQIFPPTTPVREFDSASPLLDRVVETFDARSMNALVHDVYGGVAASLSLAADPPRLNAGGRLRDLIEMIGVLGDGPLGNSGQTPEARLAADFETFFRRYREPATTAPPTVKEFEFHERISLLGDFPELLRKFGICVDLEIDLAALPGLPPDGLVAVRAVWQAGGPVPLPTTLMNHTVYHLDVPLGLFGPAERPGSGDLRDGMLRLSDPGWSVIQGELDGSASKLIDLCVNMYRRSRQPCIPPDERVMLPALLSSGFTVLRTGRSDALVGMMQNFRDLDQQLPGTRSVVLFADDLVRGYRVDVQRNDDPWRSLCQRRGRVTLGNQHDVPVDDEGYVKAASAGVGLNSDAYPNRILMHEAVFSWDGWSLCAPRPGRVILDPGDTTTPRDPNNPQVGHIENEAPPGAGFSMATDIRVTPRTLPRLRFGDAYILRARTVDLAGNSLELPEVFANHAPESQIYLRFEPVPSPVLVPRERFVEGESLEHLVVRSIIDDASLIDAFPDVPKDTSERHLAPAKTTQTMAEVHGLLDDLLVHDPAAAYALSAREQNTFLDRDFFGADIAIAAPPGVSTNFPAARGEPLAPGAYVVHTGDDLLVPYLPDPFATGVVLRGAIGEASRDFLGTWPDIQTVRFRLTRTNNSAPHIQVGVGPAPLEVALPPATIVQLSISSALREADLEQTWVWSLIQQQATSGDLEPLRQLATRGGHWMLTPSRRIELVHAVQRPLRAPRVESADIVRKAGDTFVDYSNVHIDLDAHSTGTVDVTAEWTDEVDTGGEHRFIPHSGHAFQVKVAYDDVAGVFPIAPDLNLDPACPQPLQRMRQEIGDTRHHVVRLRATGTTRFREYFPRQLWLDEQNLIRVGDLSAELHIDSSAQPDPPRIAYMLPTFEWRDVSVNERHRIGGGLRIYLERPWFSSGEGEQLAVLIAAPGQSLSDDDSKYVSQWGHDPIWLPAGPHTLSGQITAAHLYRDDEPSLPLPERPSLNVIPLGFPVRFSDERKLWFCDIELDPGTAYFPFVRLALARYQPHSVEGLDLSRVVRADFAQLTANRATTVTPDPAHENAEVTVAGPSAVNDLCEEGHRLSAVVQSRPVLGSELLWRDELGGPVALLLVTRDADGVATWRGLVPLPPREAGREYQLLIKEHEVFTSDGAPRQRIVYADAFAI